MNPRPTFEELQAARRREVAARRREIEKASRDAKGLPSPTAHRPLRLRLSDEPVDPAPPRKSDAEILRHQAAVRAALTDAEVALLDAIQDTLRRRADLRLRPEPGATPPPLPGTPEERAALREKISRVRPPAPRRETRAEAIANYRRAARRAAVEDFEDLGPAERAAEDFEDLGPADVEAELKELI